MNNSTLVWFCIACLVGVSTLLIFTSGGLQFGDSSIPPTPAIQMINMTGGNVTASSYDDYVTFVQGTGMTITPDYDLQTITFVASGAGLSEQYCTGTDKFRAYNATLNAFVCATDEQGAGGSGHTIEEEGTPLADRTGLNFVGGIITATDDAGNDETDVIISGTKAEFDTTVEDGTIVWINQANTYSGAGIQDFASSDLDNIASITSDDSDPADSGFLLLGNNQTIAWESDPTGNDQYITVDDLERFNFYGTFGIKSTVLNGASNLLLARDDATPSNFDPVANIFYDAPDDMGNNVNYGRMRVASADVTDGTEDGQYIFDIQHDGSLLGVLRLNALSNGWVDIAQGFDFGIRDDGSIYIDEKASANSDTSNFGQLWVLNSSPNSLWFTNENGEDVKLGYPDIGVTTNTDTTTNINTATWTAIPLTGTTKFMDTDSFSVSGSGIQCNYDGRVKITASVHSTSTGARVAIQIQPFINGVGTGEIGSQGYIRSGGTGHDQATSSITTIDTCVDGQVIDIRGQRESTTTTTTTMTASGSSILMVERMG